MVHKKLEGNGGYESDEAGLGKGQKVKAKAKAKANASTAKALGKAKLNPKSLGKLGKMSLREIVDAAAERLRKACGLGQAPDLFEEEPLGKG